MGGLCAPLQVGENHTQIAKNEQKYGHFCFALRAATTRAQTKKKISFLVTGIAKLVFRDNSRKVSVQALFSEGSSAHASKIFLKYFLKC